MQTSYRSSDINQIMGALAKAQGSYKKLIANEDAPGGKFSNLQAILEAVKESLATNGLGFYQYIELLDNGTGASLLWTVLGHESGQYISSCARIFSGDTDKQTGTQYEIQKRFHALMLLGIAPSEFDPVAFDDDGALLDEQHLIKTLRKPTISTTPTINPQNVINEFEYNELMIELDGYPEILNNIKGWYKIQTLADLPKSDYHKAKAKILKIKRTTEEYLNKGKR